jgi:hypothetical protein
MSREEGGIMKRIFLIVLGCLMLGGCSQPTDSPGNDPEPGPPPSLAGISLSQWPDIIVYAKGQAFDPVGLKVEGTFKDESVRELSPQEYTLDPVDTAIDGAKQVRVRAGVFSVWFPVMVNSSTAVLQSIALAKAPDKTVYALGEDFDKTGMVITGRYYDSEQGVYTEQPENVYEVTYDRTLRGEQELRIRVNRQTLSLPVEVRIPADAIITLNTARAQIYDHRQDCRQIYLKGVPFDDVPENLKVMVATNGVTVGFTKGAGISLADFSPIVDTNIPGIHIVTLTLDDASASIRIFVPDIEPEVFFDYGFWRHEGNPQGTGPGGAEQYTVSLGRSLVLAPILNLIKDASFSWEVSGGAYTGSGQNSEMFTLSPGATGNYTVTLTVDGASIATGAAVHKTIKTTVVCLSALALTPPAEVLNPSFTPPLRHFSPGQFTLRGNGYGWSLGSVLGYEVWQWRATNEFNIMGNGFGGWEEPGVVWVMCDENQNGLPDDTWYELKGSDDESGQWRPQITRRYAVTWFDFGAEYEENEYGQLTADLLWVDSKGRSGIMGGGWPSVWGVKAPRVTYAGTMIRDEGEPIYGGYSFKIPDVDWGYVDGGDMRAGPYADQNGKFFVSNAIQRDGSPANLPWIDFIKVQTAIFCYGSVFGEISTEIYSADGLGVQTDFPLP